MKKILLAMLCFSIGTATMAQDTGTTQPESEYLNEFGIDATSFVKYFLDLNGSGPSPVTMPTYYLTYRRYLGPGNIRFGIGGDYSDNESISPLDSVNVQKSLFSNSAFDMRLGWEFKTELSKRWQLYYGLDFLYGMSGSNTETSATNASYAMFTENRSSYYGAAPLLGVRFRLNDRISLLTETSFAVLLLEGTSHSWAEPITPTTPPIPDFGPNETSSLVTSFMPPLSLYITFAL